MSSATSTIRKTAHLSPKQTRKYHSKPGELLTPIKHSLLPPLVKRRVFVIRRPNTSGPSRIPALKMSDNSNEQPPPYEHATLGMPVYDGQIHPYFRLTVRVPQQFQRPPATPISTLALTTCDPTWENVPVQYIREKVALFGPELLASSLSACVRTPIPELTQTLRVHYTGQLPPTHIFSFRDARNGVRFIPIHNTVYVPHCSRLPILPSTNSSRAVPDEEGCYDVPLIPIQVYGTDTFNFLHEYLYLKSKNRLITHLRAPLLMHEPNWLAIRYGYISSLARTAVSLGISEEGLWEVLDRELALVRRELFPN